MDFGLRFVVFRNRPRGARENGCGHRRDDPLGVGLGWRKMAVICPRNRERIGTRRRQGRATPARPGPNPTAKEKTLRTPEHRKEYLPPDLAPRSQPLVA